MKKKILAAILAVVVVLAMFSCATGGKKPAKAPSIPKDALSISVRDVLSAADVTVGGVRFNLIQTVVDIVTIVDKDLDENAIWTLVNEANNDPDLVLYWVNSANQEVARLSKDSAVLNGAVVFSKYSIKNTAASLKRMARSGAAADAAAEVEDGDVELTEEEKQALMAKKAEFSDEERKELKKSLIYLACSSAALVNVPITGVEIVEQSLAIIQNPSRLAASALEIPKLIGQLQSIVDNTNNAVKTAPDVAKNIAALIEVLKAILA